MFVSAFYDRDSCVTQHEEKHVGECQPTSTDEGLTWIETYEHCTGQELSDEIGAVVVGDFFYVAYVSQIAVYSAKVIRFQSSDGEMDPIFGSQTIFNAMIGDAIRGINLCSNADTFDDRLYLFADGFESGDTTTW